HAEAARELGWSRTSLTWRLTRARELLRRRLSRRGFGLSAGLLAVALTGKPAGAALPALLVLRTVRAARLATGEPGTSGLAEQTVALTDGAAPPLLAAKVKGLLLLAVGVILGIGVAYHAAAPPPGTLPEDAPPSHRAETPIPEGEAPVRIDHLGDPLPPGAVA